MTIKLANKNPLVASILSLCLVFVASSSYAKNHPEDNVIKALVDIQQGNMSSAQQHLQPLLEHRPKFKLAHILYADVMNAQAGSTLNLNNIGNGGQTDLMGLFAEAKQRVKWNDVSESLAGKLPAALINPNKDHPFIVFADLGLSRVFLFKQEKNGELNLQHDFYASGGKQGTRKQVRGDQRTPLGVYHITSRLEDAELEDRYGPVAFPINYPNQWDLLQQRTGDGIWLHGVTSATYSRPPQDSDGCVALPNADIKVLDQFLAIGAPVIFGENENWVDPNARDIMRSELLKNIEAWRQDWESRDPDNYLSHYASDFQSKSHNIESWSAYKRRVNGSKKFIKVDVGQPIIYGYPGEKDMVQVEFEQEYTSDNYKGRALKQQYWKKQPDGQWRISYEGTIRKL